MKAKQTFLVCSCGNVFPMMRRKGRSKKSGHIKHLWCYKCKEVKAHIEKREYELTGFG